MADGDIVIGADAQPDTADIVIGTTPGPFDPSDADIIIGDAAQPDTADIVISGGPEEPPVGIAGGLLTLELPRVPKGNVWVAIVVRQYATSTPSGWNKIVDSLGVGAFWLDAYARMVDDSDIRGEDEELATVTFMSLEEQEIQGHLLETETTSDTVVLEGVFHSAFEASAAPPTPPVICQHAINKLIVVYSAEGEVELTAPAGFEELENYSSSNFSARTFLLAKRLAGTTGDIAPDPATCDPAADGYAFALVLRSTPPVRPTPLTDTVPGHIGLLGKDTRIGR